MPKRNQKVMSDEELGTVKEGRAKKIERDKHDIELIEKKKIEIAKQESKKLPAILQEKIYKISCKPSEGWVGFAARGAKARCRVGVS